jgi:ribosomal protein S27E
MQQVVCPGCGAPVRFKSSASVMAVCEYCQTTLLKDAGSVANLGKMSAILEDYSPLQIGTSGKFQQRSFTLVGRIQLQYSDGFWNEWYALFDDGSDGWLSDASGQFAVTVLKPRPADLPLFDKLAPGRSVTIAGQTYTTSDVRVARCTAGQGELPFKVGPGWEARVADFRAGDGFMSLDYSEPDAVRFYLGQGVELAALKPQLLRDASEVEDTAGRFRGKVSALSCPSCGAPVKCAPGVTVHIVCPSCHSEVDTSGATASILAAGAAVESVHFTLLLGTEISMNGVRHTILGAMRRRETDDGSSWSEYFLYAPGQKFVWLIETDDSWQQAEVLDRWPMWDGAGRATVDGRTYLKASEYGAQVTFAAGSFNWRVSVGDVVRVTEFAAGTLRLAAEITDQEMTWSRSSAVSLDQIRAWFGPGVQAKVKPHPTYASTAKHIIVLLLLVNSIPLVFATGSCLIYSLVAAAAIYIPALFLDRLDAGEA